MALGEFIVEIGLRILLEIVFYGFAYWTGFIVLKVLSCGTLKLAPLATIEERNAGKKIDWSIWLHRPKRGKALKAEATCVAGILGWIVLGIGIYAATRETGNPVPEWPPSPAPPRLESAMIPLVPGGWRTEAPGSMKPCSPDLLFNRFRSA